MADVLLVAGEDGFNVEITIFDGNTGAVKNLSGFTTLKNLDVKPTDYGAAVLANKALTFKSDGVNGILLWSISADWPATGATAGLYYGQVELNDGTANRITEQFEIKIERGVQ